MPIYSGTRARSQHPSYCRFCHNGCPILVDVEDGKAVRVSGDHSNAVYGGYTCVKGRATPEDHYHADRLLHSQKRMPDGSYEAIPVDQLIREVAERLEDIVGRHGANSVAVFTGTKVGASPMITVLCKSFLEAIESSMYFSVDTIDQPGKQVAKGMHGMWMAGPQGFDEPDVGLIVGANPLVSYFGGLPTGNPGHYLRQWSDRGFSLIVVDPRRTDVAKRAAVHLQPRPGEDVSILAGMLRVILSEDLHDHDFVSAEVAGLETLREAVEPFTPDYVARRAGIDADDLVRAARIFAAGRRGYAVASTGANMSGPGTLVEYLVLCLTTVCGRWLRAGERVAAPFTVRSPIPAKAQAMPPFPSHRLGAPLPVTGEYGSLAGLPTAALSREILGAGPNRIRALISCGGNPVSAWPDQAKTIEAMEALELLIQVDVRMSATASVADYVVAPKMSLETPSYTAIQDLLVTYAASYSGFAEPWAQWTDAIVDPPAGSDLIEEWQFFYRLARRMGLKVGLVPLFDFAPQPRIPIDMDKEPTTEELLDLSASGSRIPLDEVKKHPHGAVFPEPSMVVEPKDVDCEARLEVGNADMMSDLNRVALEPAGQSVRSASGELLDFRLVSRRMQHVYNSSGHDLRGSKSRGTYNPAFMNPVDLQGLDLEDGTLVEIRSSHSAIPAIVKSDDTVRVGVISMTHAYGGVPGRDDDVRTTGSNTGRLISVDDEPQPYTGQPRMSNIPVSVTRLPGPVPS